MQPKKITVLFNLLFCLLLSACTRDPIVDPNEPVRFSLHSAYIVCEGTESASTGLAYYDFRTGSYSTNIFNPGTAAPFLGGILLSNSIVYLTSRGILGDGAVYKLDSSGSVLNSASVSSSPSGIAVYNNKVYISTGFDSTVTVLNSVSLSFIKKIKAGLYPDEILGFNGKIFVCNSQTLGGAIDNRVSVIDVSADTLIKHIRVSPMPSSIILSNDNKIIVGCSRSSGAIMYKIDPFALSVIDSLILPNGFISDMSLNSLTNEIFFIQDNTHIGLADFISRNVLTSVTVSEPGAQIFSYAYDTQSAKHSIGAAFSITPNGKFYIYSSSGNLEKTFETLPGPGKIVIKNPY
ncbi:hypothetical protein BH10BAC5_BH10BAC5_29100 [soil metagenome]